MFKKIHFYRTYIILSIAFILVLITGVGVYQGNQNKEALTEAVIHAFQVLNVTDEILASLVNAETGQRGYLLTNSSEYLEPFNTAKEEIYHFYDLLVVLQQGNEEELTVLRNQLKPKIDERLRLLQETVDLHQMGEDDAALNIVMTNVGKGIMDEIRIFINDLKNREEQILQWQTDEMQILLGQNDLLFFTGFGFILLAIGIAGVSIKKRAQENNRLLRRIDDANINLLQSKDREAIKSRFMGIVAHDLRNPLSMIKSINGMMIEEKDQLSDEHAEFVDYIEQASEQMKYLINELLDAQKIEDGKVEVYMEEFHVSKIILGLILGHRDHAKEKEIELNFTDNSEGEHFKTDKSIFLQVADNLISNAIKYSPSSTEVNIFLEAKNNRLVLRVTDQGPGIKKEEQNQLFERYSKLSNRPTGGEKSTGLGLWIVKERITALGGTIQCESEEGKGSSFTAVFPLEEEPKMSV